MMIIGTANILSEKHTSMPCVIAIALWPQVNGIMVCIIYMRVVDVSRIPVSACIPCLEVRICAKQYIEFILIFI